MKILKKKKRQALVNHWKSNIGYKKYKSKEVIGMYFVKSVSGLMNKFFFSLTSVFVICSSVLTVLPPQTVNLLHVQMMVQSEYGTS